jgi:N utilization substance protein A
LASRLTNWRIDVTNESRYERQKQTGYQSILLLEGLTEELADRLYEAGITSLPEFLEASLTELEDLTRLNQDVLAAMRQQAISLHATTEKEEPNAEQGEVPPAQAETSGEDSTLDSVTEG